MNNCQDIRDQLMAMDLNTTILDSPIKEHLHSCEACTEYLHSLQALDQSIDALPEYDVSDEVFNQTLLKIKADQSQVNNKDVVKSHRFNQQWATGLAASFVLIAVTGLIYNGTISEFQADFTQVPYASEEGIRESETRQSATAYPAAQKPMGDTSENDEAERFNQASDGSSLAGDYYADTDIQDEKGAQTGEFSMRKEEAPMGQPIPTSQADLSTDTLEQLGTVLPAEVAMGPGKLNGSLDDQDALSKQGNISVTGSRSRRQSPQAVVTDSLSNVLVDGSSAVTQFGGEAADSTATASGLTQAPKNIEKASQARDLPLDQLVNNKDQSYSLAPETIEEGLELKRNHESLQAQTPERNDMDGLVRQPKLVADSVAEAEPLVDFNREVNAAKAKVIAKKADKRIAESKPAITINERKAPSTNNVAIEYLASLQSTDNLSFKTASGYWANTYVPGDPNMRWIQAKIKQAGGLDLPVVQQNRQPFDYPQNVALAVYLNSDHKTVNESGPTRMRLQVGVQAGQQQGGHRAALNLAVILDAADQAQQPAVAALLSALLKAKQSSDKISVYLAGHAGGRIIDAEDFRHGSIQVALDEMFSTTTKQAKVSALSTTLQAANDWLTSQDDPNAVLGSSAVLLIAADNTTSDLASIESMVAKQAIDGITFSTLSLDGGAHRRQLERLALMGQGHSRVLTSVQDAQRVINAELLVSSRAVARALRLQIRLAEGVQLIDVLDSYSLNEQQAQKVRAAEQSLDQRTAKNLGIAADRGADDEGIQIVIPSYFAGDTHVILLDVLVDKPGPVIDVLAKYKDLIYLRNATSQVSLNLEQGQNQLGPLEHNVMKNVLAHRLTESLEQASQAMRMGHQTLAVSGLQNMLELYQAMRSHIQAWQEDPEILQDEQILQQYLQLLNTQSSIDPNKYQLIADSMSYMSWRKLLSHSP